MGRVSINPLEASSEGLKTKVVKETIILPFSVSNHDSYYVVPMLEEVHI